MDLVDIDQVLDNLELREAADEHIRAQLQAKNAVESSNHAEQIDAVANVNGTNHKSSFVGVSQVFNSLDDYQKNVESLENAPAQRYDEECRLISNNTNVETIQYATTTAAAAEIEPKSFNISNLSNSMKGKSSRNLTKNIDKVVNAFDSSTDDRPTLAHKQIYDEDSDADEEASGDLHKFSENNRHSRRIGYEMNDTADNSLLSTSDSLTTSSSSTFSSGPSPGIVSTTDEQSVALTPDECFSEDRDALLPHNSNTKDSVDDDNDKQVNSGAMNINKAKTNVVDVEVVSLHPGECAGSIEDIAVGLSSISITTGNSQLNLPTASSVLENVWENLSETSENSLLSKELKECQLKDTQPELMAKKDVQKVKPVEKPEQKVNTKFDDNALTPPQTQAPKIIQQPITFGSTMDEISDTELDSMLQEMDIDDGSEVDGLPKLNVGGNRNSPPPLLPVESATSKVETIDAVDTKTNTDNIIYQEAHKTLERKTSLANESDEHEMVVGSASNDSLNADSFSQASTVEFSEIRAHTIEAVQADSDMPPSTNSVASSYTGSECSLEGRVIDTTTGVSAKEEADAVGIVNNERKDSGENADDEEEGSTDEGAYNDAAVSLRPQRPTSLNLPTIQSNLYENAGQTPPGTQSTQNKILQLESAAVNSYASANSDNGSNTTTAEGQISTPVNADTINGDLNEEASGYSDPFANLGKVPPIWVPDNMAAACMQCHAKFTMIKRRHHCRACGKVLCSVCCSQKFKLEFLSNAGESRVCLHCYLILTQKQQQHSGDHNNAFDTSSSNDDGRVANANTVAVSTTTTTTTESVRSPNPNNPMEYCSTIPPYRQVNIQNLQPPSVVVPVGVLKKEGSSYSSNSSNGGSSEGGKKGRKRKSVMFSDGIAPGSDLASIEHQWADAKHARRGAHQHSEKSRNSSGVANKPSTPVRAPLSGSSGGNSDATAMGLVAALFRGSIPPLAAAATVTAAQEGREESTKTAISKLKSATIKSKEDSNSVSQIKRLPPKGADENGCFIPTGDNNNLPPIYVPKNDTNCDFDYKKVTNNEDLVRRLQSETIRFAVEKNFFVDVKILNLKCCMNRTVINFTTCGMHHVGNDELIILLEFEPLSANVAAHNNENSTKASIPKDIFIHLYEIYRNAELGTPIAELSYTSPRSSNFLGKLEYGGFIFIRATFQCLQDVLVPEQPFLIGILIHRNEVPWAKVFPLRLMLRLGAQYRYYPCPHISICNREPVYAEIAQTIINFLADFRNYSYTMPCIKGMYIHMEDRQTTVTIPRNRHEDIVKVIKNTSDHILAFGGNFSKTADGHLVCMQNVNDMGTEMYAYSTQAINIQGQPRKVTGTSFFVLNESLKSESGLSGKCSIVEDGLMIQILPSKMEEIKCALQSQKDVEIICGPIDADDQQTEVVSLKWVDNDRDFNVGVKSPIDEKDMEGISSMRVHDSFNYSNSNYAIRLTDIYIIKYDEWYASAQSAVAATSMDITRMAGQIARSACVALVPFLDLIVSSGTKKLALRATLHQENVCYEAGARGNKLPPLYMNALDDQLIPTLHGESSGIEDAIILELVFYILNV